MESLIHFCVWSRKKDWDKCPWTSQILWWMISLVFLFKKTKPVSRTSLRGRKCTIQNSPLSLGQRYFWLASAYRTQGWIEQVEEKNRDCSGTQGNAKTSRDAPLGFEIAQYHCGCHPASIMRQLFSIDIKKESTARHWLDRCVLLTLPETFILI